MSQKIIIPKGLINPDETTIIEIPEEVQNLETVVAKPMYMNRQTTGEVCDADEDFEYLYSEMDQAIEPKIKYIEEEIFDEEIENRRRYKKPTSRKHNLRNTSSYPLYEYCDKNMRRDAAYYSYNCVSKPLTNFDQNLEEKDMFSLLSHQSKDCTFTKKLTAKDVISVLDILEKVELNRLCKNLKDYQGARRRLLCETANIHTFEDVTASLSGLY